MGPVRPDASRRFAMAMGMANVRKYPGLSRILQQDKMTHKDPKIQARIARLKLWRKKKARKRKLAPYLIFSNWTLMIIAQENPVSLTELAQIPGFGEKRIAQHGMGVINVLRKCEC